MISSVRDYFAVNWLWTTPEQQERYVNQDLELCAIYMVPDALDDRIELIISLWNMVFLVDDIIDHWSYDQVCLTIMLLHAKQLNDKLDSGTSVL